MKRVGFFAGTFDPFHIGHMDILRKAEKNFDEVIVGIGMNSSKSNSSALESRLGTLQGILKEFNIIAFDGLIGDFINSYELKK